MELVIDLPKEIPNFSKLSSAAIQYFLYRSSETLVNDIKEFTPKKDGDLRGAWTPRLSKFELRVTNTMEYARYVEEGTGLYGPNHRLITPKGDKPMHANIGGETIFFWSHKGFEGRKMAEKGKEKFRAKIPLLAAEAVKRTTK